MHSLAKKRKLSRDENVEDGNEDDASKINRTSLASLIRSVTPPLTTRARQFCPAASEQQQNTRRNQHHKTSDGVHTGLDEQNARIIRSPIQLTHIRDLPPGNNIDSVQLRDILGDPMIRECWQFNYCFDVDFVMDQFDQDVKDIVQVKIVHGSWKTDSANRIRIDEACARYTNVEPIVAYMPEAFGTHHSKMMILLRHDDLAQVIIHTANMLAGDWTNMSQAVWRSPLLPLASTKHDLDTEGSATFGAGARFKRDLLTYLEFYGKKKTGSLVDQLRGYDFKAVRAVLIASVPSREKASRADSSKATLWGWPALKDALRQVPLRIITRGTCPHIIIQISSVASLGQTDKWLQDTFFDSLCPSSGLSSTIRTNIPKYSIIFPTPDEIRRSLNGYGSGGSIHMKLQSATQQKQLQYMRPYLCHWAGDREQSPTVSTTCPDSYGPDERAILQKREAGRRRAAPHIKTYIRFSDSTKMDCIDWAMITSANLSTQAWGAAANSAGEVRICSWEIGVLVWPDLIASSPCRPATNEQVQMVPCFKKDMPDSIQSEHGASLVGFRMPYDLPLTPYSVCDRPWCATTNHAEPDWLGQTWEA